MKRVKVVGTYSVYIPELYQTLYEGREYEVPEEVAEKYRDWLEPVEPVQEANTRTGKRR